MPYWNEAQQLFKSVHLDWQHVEAHRQEPGVRDGRRLGGEPAREASPGTAGDCSGSISGFDKIGNRH